MNFETIHNYYERLVLQRIHEVAQAEGNAEEVDFWEDVACVALNQLPSRYVRHDVDLIFYMTPDEQAQVNLSVRDAVQMARQFVTSHRGTQRPATIHQEEKLA